MQVTIQAVPTRILLLSAEAYRMVGGGWERDWRWHTWTIEDSYQTALDGLRRLRIDLNPAIQAGRLLPADMPY